MPLPPGDSPSTRRGCRLVDDMKLHGREKGFSLNQLPKKKVAATLDRSPPMLYNGVAKGKYSRLCFNPSKNASE